MNKTQYLELLIKSFGLIPDVHSYRTSGNDGEYEVGVGWKGTGVDENGYCIINFAEPDGFNMAVYEILKQAIREGLRPIYIDPKD